MAGSSWCRKFLCATSDLLVFCCQITSLDVLSVRVLLVVVCGCIMKRCCRHEATCCRCWLLGGSPLSSAACWKHGVHFGSSSLLRLGVPGPCGPPFGARLGFGPASRAGRGGGGASWRPC